MEKLRWPLVLVLALGMALFAIGCGDDDDDDDNGTGPSEQTVDELLIGSWESSGALVAPLLVSFYQTDTVRVTFTEATVLTREHRADGTGWQADQSGTYTVTLEDAGEIHSIEINYTEAAAYIQQGIFQVIEATLDTMKLEVVIPSLATPPTPADGFGTTVSGTNIQTFVRTN